MMRRSATPLVSVLWSCCLLGRAAGFFYGYYSPPGCRWSEPGVRPTPLVAGRLGFFGASGDGGPAALARFRLPRALALDAAGELLFVSDALNHAVRVVDLRAGSSGSGISTVLGRLGEAGASGDGGAATEARLREPNGLALDLGSRRLYVADQGNHAIRVLDMSNSSGRTVEGIVTTVAGMLGVAGSSGAGGPATSALLDSPAGLALDVAGQRLYIADMGNNRLCVLDLQSGELHAIDSDIPLSSPAGLAVDPAAEALYVADYGSHTVLRVDVDSGNTTLVAGTPGVPGGRGDAGTQFRGDEGMALEALLKNPHGLALDTRAQRLFVADSANPAVRVIDLDSGKITIAVQRPGYYGHGLSEEDAGLVGLALDESHVPGLEVRWTVHANQDPKPWTTEGEYFHFNASGVTGIVPEDAVEVQLPGKNLPPSALRLVRQFRRGVLIWVGQARFWDERTFLIGQRQRGSNYAKFTDPVPGTPCPECTATGVREPPGICVPAPCEKTEFIWEVGDVLQILGLAPDFRPETEIHKEPAVQKLYMAEGMNFAVRVTNVAHPPQHICAHHYGCRNIDGPGQESDPRCQTQGLGHCQCELNSTTWLIREGIEAIGPLNGEYDYVAPLPK